MYVFAGPPVPTIPLLASTCGTGRLEWWAETEYAWRTHVESGGSPGYDTLYVVDPDACVLVSSWQLAYTGAQGAEYEVLDTSPTVLRPAGRGPDLLVTGAGLEAVIGARSSAYWGDVLGGLIVHSDEGTWRLADRSWTELRVGRTTPCSVERGVPVDSAGRVLVHDRDAGGYVPNGPALGPLDGAVDTPCLPTVYHTAPDGQETRTVSWFRHWRRAQTDAWPDPAAAVLHDGWRACGQRRHPSPFRDVLGDCDGFAGVTDQGAAFLGSSERTERVSPPVGVAISVAGTPAAPVFGGTEALAFRTASGWRRVPVDVGARGLTQSGDTLWWTDGRQLCSLNLAEGAPICVPSPGEISHLAPVIGAVWTDAGGELRRYTRSGGWDVSVQRLDGDVVASNGARLYTIESAFMYERDPTTGVPFASVKRDEPKACTEPWLTDDTLTCEGTTWRLPALGHVSR